MQMLFRGANLSDSTKAVRRTHIRERTRHGRTGRIPICSNVSSAEFAAEFRRLGPRLLAARRYLDAPGGNRLLASLVLERLDAQRAALTSRRPLDS